MIYTSCVLCNSQILFIYLHLFLFELHVYMFSFKLYHYDFFFSLLFCDQKNGFLHVENIYMKVFSYVFEFIHEIRLKRWTIVLFYFDNCEKINPLSPFFSCHYVVFDYIGLIFLLTFF